jgi:argininosuccinate synthase
MFYFKGKRISAKKALQLQQKKGLIISECDSIYNRSSKPVREVMKKVDECETRYTATKQLYDDLYNRLTDAAEQIEVMNRICMSREFKEQLDENFRRETDQLNDQIRFDLIFQTIAPDIEIITPIRDLKLSRQEEVDYLAKNGVHYSWEKAQYSINKGLWGTSVGGKETLTSHEALPSEAYPSQLQKQGEEKVVLEFQEGQLVAVNEKKDTPPNNIVILEKMANAYAIGRDIHVGDTIIGIKGRVGFEAAAPLIIIKAHHLLEKHTLGKWQQYWKEQLGNWYGMLFHEGQFLDPVMRNIETFLEDTQKTVNGTVTVTLKPYHFSLDGIESKNDLMNTGFGQYGEMNNAWTSDDAKGFIKILGNAQNIFSSVNQETYE